MPDWLPKEWSLQTAYAACAAVGAVVVILQLVLGLFGSDADDADGFDFDGDAGLDILTVRGIASFLTVFGLLGWIGTAEGWHRGVTLLVALAGGASVLLVVALFLRAQKKLHSSGNIDANGAVGQIARVYLHIPAANGGTGKITVQVQGRTAEYSAFTRGRELATGSSVRVVRMTAPGHFEVTPLEEQP